MGDRIGKTITTYSGVDFWPMDPRPEEVVLMDIAHVLSMLCRFGGHCSKFYSVAQHSVLVSQILERSQPEQTWKTAALVGLLHDASETYLVDLPRPIKSMLPDYKVIERKVEAVIWERFDLVGGAEQWATEVKAADRIALSTECRDLMPPGTATWADCQTHKPNPDAIEPLLPDDAMALFLGRYYWLCQRLGIELAGTNR